MRRLTNVRLPKPICNCEGDLWWVLLDEHDTLLAINPMEHGSAIAGESWGGDWLSPMGIDLQMNGGLGVAFPEITFDDLPKLFDLLDRLWVDGVEAICPTFITCDLPSLHMGLSVLREARKNPSSQRCKLLGAHLEGPFLSKNRKGAHNPEHLCLPNLSKLDQLIGGIETEIGLFTLAPELNGSLDVIKRLNYFNIVVCLGHSSANADESNSSFANGVRMLTHAFNAMPGLQHRSPGPIGAALNDGDIAIGLIADGVHVHPNVAALLQRLAANQLVLVSDAIAPYGLEDGRYIWDKRSVRSENGSCWLEDGTLAGSTLSLLDACKNLSLWNGNPTSAIWSATIAPRLVLDKEQTIDNYLLGRPLNQLLRWTMSSNSDELSWHQAV